MQRQALKAQQYLRRFEAELAAARAESSSANTRLKQDADAFEERRKEADKYEAVKQKLQKQTEEMRTCDQGKEEQLKDAKDAIRVKIGHQDSLHY